jgi:membrane-bound metal-dependent hydrolase YbcI (DUF457 family)
MMNDSPFISRLVYRLFLLSWIFAVLWVKEYLWWTFTLAGLLLLLSEIILPMAALSGTNDSKPMVSPSNPTPSSSGSVDDGDPDVWREPKPPRSSSRSKKS